MCVKERLKEFIKHSKINTSQFEKSIGVSNGYVNSISKNIGIDRIDYMLEKYPNLNLEWLLTGRGEMLRTSPSETPTQTLSVAEMPANQPPIASKSTTNQGIPLIPIDAMAGFATETYDGVELTHCEHYNVPEFTRMGCDFLIRVSGSSMSPKYHSGDIVACKHLPMSDIFFQWNKVYVLDTEQGPLIKRVKKGSDIEHVLIISENDKYEPFELHLSKVRSVAIVLGVIRLE